MRRLSRITGCLIMLLAALRAWCIPAEEMPYIGYVYPAGGQQGTNLRVMLGGQRLRGVEGVLVTGTGVSGVVVSYEGASGPLTQAQITELRRRLQEIRQGRQGRAGQQAKPAKAKSDGAAPAAIALPDLPELRDLEGKSGKELQQIAERFIERPKKRKAPLAEEVVLEITIAADATPGARELRLVTPRGVSNPRPFYVGVTPEFREPWAFTPDVGPKLAPTEAPVTLNGQILPGEVDRYPVRLRAGQPVAVTVRARALIPYLADAVPGWFQAVAALYDSDGARVAYADDHGCDPDPVLTYRAPADGVYHLEIRDAIYRGRQDFVYRVTVGAPEAPASTQDVPRATEREAEPNDQWARGASGAMPRVIDGRIAAPGDVDGYRIAARAGDVVVAEVYGRRIGSPIDALVRVLDAEGRVLALNDDREDKSAGLLTHHADAYVAVTIPRDGTYGIEVSDAQRHGGDAYRYLLRITPPRPDFALRVTPSGVSMPAGQSIPLTVTALRADGWAGEIEVLLRDAPAGFTLQGARIPAGCDSVAMTLTAPHRKIDHPVPLRLEGRAVIDGVTVTRPVIPAEQMMQAFAYQHLVPARQLLVTVTRMAGPPRTLAMPEAPVRIPAGGTVACVIGLGATPGDTVTLELKNPPAGITLTHVAYESGKLVLTLAAEARCAGTAGNLIVEGFTRTTESRKGNAAPRQRRTSVGYLPAIPFSVSQP